MEEILQVNGLDAILIGPYDLSASMGITGKFDSKEFGDVMAVIINYCKKYNLPYGEHIVQPNPELMKMRIGEGHRFIAYSIDAVFLYHSAQQIK